jgi:hypothetical protein
MPLGLVWVWLLIVLTALFSIDVNSTGFGQKREPGDILRVYGEKTLLRVLVIRICCVPMPALCSNRIPLAVVFLLSCELSSFP